MAVAAISFWEGSHLVVLARLVASDGVYVDPDDVEYIDLDVYEVGGDPDTAVYQEVIAGTDVDSVVLAAVVEPVTDPRWKRDTIGYNFIHALEDPDYDLSGSREFRIEYVLDMAPTSGLGPQHVILTGKPQSLRSR